jgi:hypothetical protein
MMDTLAKSTAKVWIANRTSIERWMEDYGRRSGKTRDEIVSERNSHRFHDDRASVIGTYDGYRLSVCPISHDMFSYTVRTPWDESEGLYKTRGRDDARVIELLRKVISYINDASDKQGHVASNPPQKSASPSPKTPRKRVTKKTAAKKQQTDIKLVTRQIKPKKNTSSCASLHVPLYDTRMVNERKLTLWIYNAKSKVYEPNCVWTLDGEQYVMGEDDFMHMSLVTGERMIAEHGKAPEKVIQAKMRSLGW